MTSYVVWNRKPINKHILKINAAEVRIFIREIELTRKGKVQIVKSKLGGETIIQKARESCLRWYGHDKRWKESNMG